MKILALLLALIIAPFAAQAGRTGPVLLQALPTCSITPGQMVTYNATTGVFSCLSLTGQTLTWSVQQNFNIIGTYLAKVNTQAATTYTLVAADCGTKILFTSGSATTVTVPAGLTVGCQVSLTQYGAGRVSVAANGTTIRSPHAYTGTSAQYATIALTEDQTNIWTFVGDGS